MSGGFAGGGENTRGENAFARVKISGVEKSQKSALSSDKIQEKLQGSLSQSQHKISALQNVDRPQEGRSSAGNILLWSLPPASTHFAVGEEIQIAPKNVPNMSLVLFPLPGDGLSGGRSRRVPAGLRALPQAAPRDLILNK